MSGLIFPRIETRIMVGILMFVATMVLVGWVAINETGRMASFESQHLARSIERGGESFATRCATCHGTDGRGLLERAPGLNNPQLFGWNPFADINSRVEVAQRTLRERENLLVEFGTANAERQTEILARVNEIDEQYSAEAVQALYTERQDKIASLQAAIDAGYLPGIESLTPGDEAALTNFLNIQGSRLVQFGWTGDLHGYVKTTLIHGRPGSANVWGGNQMAAWSLTAGGPLRDDQIEDITNYILNWDKGDGWTEEDLLAVKQFGKLHADGALVSAGPSEPPVGTDVAVIVTNLASVTGDPARGDALYNGRERTQVRSRLGCASCHAGGAQAPATEGTGSRLEAERLTLPQFAGYTVDQYLVESIVNPGAYVVDGYAAGVMPAEYGNQLSIQDIADIIAYLKAQ